MVTELEMERLADQREFDDYKVHETLLEYTKRLLQECEKFDPFNEKARYRFFKCHTHYTHIVHPLENEDFFWLPETVEPINFSEAIVEAKKIRFGVYDISLLPDDRLRFVVTVPEDCKFADYIRYQRECDLQRGGPYPVSDFLSKVFRRKQKRKLPECEHSSIYQVNDKTPNTYITYSWWSDEEVPEGTEAFCITVDGHYKIDRKLEDMLVKEMARKLGNKELNF